jgi:hypothetical protein
MLMVEVDGAELQNMPIPLCFSAISSRVAESIPA